MRNLLIILLFICAKPFAQHTPLLNQYMFNGVALNPAYTGSEEALSMVATLRAQWIGFPGAPTTQAFTIHAPLKKSNSAIGLQVFADQIGINRNTGIFGSYAYRIRFKESTLSFGLAGGINLQKTYYSRLDVVDLQDQLLINDSPMGILPDFSFGIHYYSTNYFLSFSAPFFLTHDYDGVDFNITNDFKNYNLMLGGGYVFRFKNELELKPSVLAKYRYKEKLQFDFNLMLKFSQYFGAGISYRTNDALIALININVTKQFAIMYSFGMPLSPIFKYNSGSHELSLKYNMLFKTGLSSPRFLGF